MSIKLQTPLQKETLESLTAGDRVLLSGVIYTGRDAAHQRFSEALEAGRELPFPLAGAVLYYVGPSPTRPGRVIGAAGPTTATRMDAYAPALYDRGLAATIGKGRRGDAVVAAMVQNGAVYLGAVGGAAAVLAGAVREAQVIAYEDLGTEAVRRLLVADLPLIVLVDSRGNDLYESGPAAWRQARREQGRG